MLGNLEELAKPTVDFKNQAAVAMLCAQRGHVMLLRQGNVASIHLRVLSMSIDNARINFLF